MIADYTQGGAIICHDEKTKKRIDFLKNFGFADEVTVIEPGINAKMNELQSAYGLVQLKYIDGYIKRRKEISDQYRENLKTINGVGFLSDIENVEHSYTYFPILIDESAYGESRDALYERLKLNNINGRRYFYPLISQFPIYKGLPSARADNLPISNRIARQVLCLPLYPNLDKDTVDFISLLIARK